MIFGADMIEKILADKKTQTRRVPSAEGSPCRYRPNRVYGVQPGRGKTAVAWIRVKGVARVTLGSINDADAIAEGFRHRGEFVGYWKELHGSWDPMQKVDIIRFGLVKAKDSP